MSSVSSETIPVMELFTTYLIVSGRWMALKTYDNRVAAQEHADFMTSKVDGDPLCGSWGARYKVGEWSTSDIRSTFDHKSEGGK